MRTLYPKLDRGFAEREEDPALAEIARGSGLVPPGTFLGTRASTAKGQAKVLNLLKVARAIVIERGFLALSVRELSRAAGVSIGHVQYYFETYEDLIEAVLFYNSALYTAQRLLIDDDGASVRERLQARFTWLVVDAMQPDTAAYFFELWSISLKEARFARVMDANYQNVVLRVAGLIGEARPDLPDQERRQRAVLVSSHIEGLLVHFCRPRTDDLDSDAFVAKAVDTLMKLALD